MSEWRKFLKTFKTAPKSDIAVMIITFVLTVIFDLVVAIEVGMLLAAMLFMKRMSEETTVKGWEYSESNNDSDDLELKAVPKNVRVYEVSGPLFFGAADKILDITFKEYTSCLILRMKGVTAVDATAMNSLEQLYEKCQERGIVLILSHVSEQPLHAMQKVGFYEKVGAENFCKHIDDALNRATEIEKN